MNRFTTTRLPLAPIETLAAFLADGIEGAAARLRVWRETSDQRAALARLTPEQLADLGLGEAEIAREASRPFWDLPRRLR